MSSTRTSPGSRWKRLLAVAAAMVAIAIPLGSSPANAGVVEVADPHISSITYGGTGCPHGTVGSSFSNDRTTFTLVFDQFVASQGPAVPIIQNRENCQLNFNVTTSAPVSRVLELDYRGYLSVPSGASAEVQSIAYLPGETETGVTTSETWQGPASKDYLFTQGICVVVSEAGTSPASVNAQVRMMGDASQAGQLTIDSIDGRLLEESCGVEVAVTGVTDGETYLFQGAPKPGCSTTDAGGGISAVATLSLSGSAPGIVTATCSGAANAAGIPILPASATYSVICAVSNVYTGTISTKLNARLVSTSEVTSQATYHPTTCELTGLVLTPVDAGAAGTIQVDSAVGWKLALKTAVQNWTFKKSAQSLPSGAIFINGQMRPMDLTSSLQVKFTNGTNNLYFKATGSAPNGAGTAKSGFEITTTGLGLAAER